MQMKRIIFVALCIMAIIKAHAGQNYVWTGAGANNSWATAANWLPNGVPGTDVTDNVTIQKTTTTCPKLDQNRTVANLVLAEQTLDLNGFKLTVTGNASAISAGIINNGLFDLSGEASIDLDQIIDPANFKALTIQTSAIVSAFNYTTFGAIDTKQYLAGGTNGIQFLFPQLLGLDIDDAPQNVFVDLVINNPAIPDLVATIQLTVNSYNQIIAVNVVDDGDSYPMPITYYSLYNNKSFLSFNANLLTLLFQTCNSAVVNDNMNYVRTQILQIPCLDPSTIDNLPVESVVQVTDYFDGLGRPIEKVAKQISPQKRDIIKVIDYDDRFNTVKNYLPFSADKCNGTYIPYGTALTQQQNYYTVNNDPLIPKVVDPTSYNGTQNNAYSMTVYENSQLQRPIFSVGAGDAWKLNKEYYGFYPDDVNPGKVKKYVFRTNTASEVLFWTYDDATGNASAISNNLPIYYGDNTLMVNESYDEDGALFVQYSDMDGKLLLKRQKKDAATFMDTYYVYDDFGRIMYIIPPQATSLLSTQNYAITPGGIFTYTWLFVYTYDARHRLSTKKIPGSDPRSIVYDRLNRPVLTQDGNQVANKEWLFTKYDVVSRPIMTGLYTDAQNNTQATFQTLYDGTITNLYETRSSATGNIEGYSNIVFPTSITSANVLTANYYDDYDFDNNTSPDYSYVDGGLGTYEPTGIDNSPRGYATCTKERILDGVNQPWLFTIGFYDSKGRMVQAQSNNQLYLIQHPSQIGTISEYTTVAYDFAGKILQTKQQHNPGVVATTTIFKQYTYDHVGRLLNVTQQNNTDSPVMMAKYKYNELGQPIEKNLHSENTGTSFLQSIDYRFNIRGWLTSINNSGLTNDYNVTNNDADDLFGMNLVYESDFNGFNIRKYNGSITAVKWRTNNVATNSVATERAYTYTYDMANQLTSANYFENTGTGWQTSAKYKESNLKYDLNGNITNLARTDAAGATMDDLVYIYTGNQITAMTDAGIKAAGFISTSIATTQYTYDKNGNLTIDANKEITLTYNYFNQIKTVTGTGSKAGKSITYTYDANGNKLNKSVTSGTVTTVTYYVNGFVYEYANSTYKLQFFDTDEGRAVPKASGTSFDLQYTISDHLGSARITFGKGSNGKAEVVQEDHYYAMGLRMGGLSYAIGAPKNNYLFGKNEAEDDYNLLNQYDYGFRQYDPTIGRWHSQDLLSDMYHSSTPYHYCGNDFINKMDILGLAAGQNGLSTGESVPNDNFDEKKPKCPNGKDAEKKAEEARKARQKQKTEEKKVKQPPTKPKAEEKKDPEFGNDRILEIKSGNDSHSSGNQSNGQNKGTYGNSQASLGTSITWEAWRITFPTLHPALTSPLFWSVAVILGITASDTRKDEKDDEFYYHYTNEQGYRSIMSSRNILPNRKGKVYITNIPMSPERAMNDLFLGQNTHIGRGDYLIKFKLNSHQKAQLKFDPSSPFELVYPNGTLRIDPNNLIFGGLTLFTNDDYRKTRRVDCLE